MVDQGAESQRKRWEEGHIGIILAEVPHLFYAAISYRNIALLALTLDLLRAAIVAAYADGGRNFAGNWLNCCTGRRFCSFIYQRGYPFSFGYERFSRRG